MVEIMHQNSKMMILHNDLLAFLQNPFVIIFYEILIKEEKEEERRRRVHGKKKKSFIIYDQIFQNFDEIYFTVRSNKQNNKIFFVYLPVRTFINGCSAPPPTFEPNDLKL